MTQHKALEVRTTVPSSLSDKHTSTPEDGSYSSHELKYVQNVEAPVQPDNVKTKHEQKEAKTADIEQCNYFKLFSAAGECLFLSHTVHVMIPSITTHISMSM